MGLPGIASPYWLSLRLQVLYASGKMLLKSYLLRPPLPEAAYYHGLQESACRATMEAETRRIVVRWLEAANPAIPKPVALAVLDTERCGGRGWQPLLARCSAAGVSVVL